jgi:predicted amidohydrolase YtcJ
LIAPDDQDPDASELGGPAIDPTDFARYAHLDAIPVLSMQWEKPAPDTIDNARDYLGPARFKYMEPAGVLAAAGARIAYGSDWPVDSLNEWFALKVGVTRANSPDAGPQYAGRLSGDPGLTRKEVLRAITVNSSYELHQTPRPAHLRPASSPISSSLIEISSKYRRSRSRTSRFSRPS